MTISKKLGFALTLLPILCAGFAYQYGVAQGKKDASTHPIVATPTEEKRQSPVAQIITPEIPKINVQSGVLETEKQGPNQTEASELIDIASSLELIDNLPRKNRYASIDDLFTYLANNNSPSEAFAYANSLKSGSEHALRVLFAEWHLNDQNLSADQEDKLRRQILSSGRNRFGVEVEMTNKLLTLNLSPEIKQAWIQSTENHVNRSLINATLQAKDFESAPNSFLTTPSDWSPWEKENYQRSLVKSWANNDPKAAWNWFVQNRDSLTRDLSDELTTQWANKDPQGLAERVHSISDNELRQGAIKSAAKALTLKSSGEAVAWADSIENLQDRDIAYETIYNNSIKGIGAQIGTQDGLPKIQKIIANGPLVNSGVLAGDLIVETVEENGTTNNLYGKDLRSVINLLRGEPGSNVQLRVLRTNPSTGNIEEKLIETSRDLLIIDRNPG